MPHGTLNAFHVLWHLFLEPPLGKDLQRPHPTDEETAYDSGALVQILFLYSLAVGIKQRANPLYASCLHL